MLKRTLRQLDEDLGSDELAGWTVFEALYGIPDVYFLTGQVCTTIAHSLGSNSRAGPEDFVPYLRAVARSVAEREFDDEDAIERDAVESMAIAKALAAVAFQKQDKPPCQSAESSASPISERP